MGDFSTHYKHHNLLNFNGFVNLTFSLKTLCVPKNWQKKKEQLKWLKIHIFRSAIIILCNNLDVCIICAYICFMNYQWDPEKAESNFLTHSVDFADSVGVFEDIWALTLKEEIVSGEQRFATLGTDFFGRILVVVYTYRNEDIRLISARPATRRERRIYEQKRTSF